MLDTDPSCNPVQYQGKIMMQTWENGKKPNFRPNFVQFGPLTSLWVLPLLNVRHCRKLWSYSISRKAYDPNSRKWKKPHFGPDLGPLSRNLGCQIFFIKQVVGHCSKVSSYATERKTNESNLRICQKI